MQKLSVIKLLFLALFISSSAKAQTAESTPKPVNPHAYRFQTSTIWAKLSVIIIDQNGHFQLECQSDSPMEGWVLTNQVTSQPVANSNDDTGNSFKINVAKPFDDYELTVFVDGNDEQIPMIIALQPDKKSAYTLPLYEPFQENASRPYNTLVKSLYDQAGQAYIQGDNKGAIDLLEKAEKVDATEPQVLTFMEKLNPQPTVDHSSENFVKDSLSKAQKAEADKNIHEAKNWYMEVLKVEPKNVIALDGMKRLQSQLLEQAAKLLENDLKDGDYKKAQPILVKIKQAFPDDVRIKDWQARISKLANTGNPNDRKAKADEAYNLGLESYRKDDFASAKKFWEETLQIDPQYIQAQQNLDRLNQEHPGL